MAGISLENAVNCACPLNMYLEVFSFSLKIFVKAYLCWLWDRAWYSPMQSLNLWGQAVA